MSHASTAPERLRVELGARGYDILVGRDLMAGAGELLRPVLRRPRVAIVTDETVARLHLATVTAALKAAGITADAITVPAGESSKSMAELSRLLDRLLDLKIERNDAIIALGGGVVGDLAGFAAAILRRGVALVQMPTTLLAQVDSSVGGKTAINTRHGKNLVGAFHQPRLVLADVGALASLPPRELKAGYAEVVKHGLLGDFAFYEWLEQNGAALLAGDPARLTYAVIASCRIKSAIVARDERESDVRALLNLGHTFAHAYEAEGQGRDILHGEAVAAGLIQEAELSHRLDHCPAQDVARVRRHFDAVALPASPADLGLNDVPPARLLEHMRQDKKVADGRVTFVLLRRIGEAFVSPDVPEADVLSTLSKPA